MQTALLITKLPMSTADQLVTNCLAFRSVQLDGPWRCGRNLPDSSGIPNIILQLYHVQ